MGLHGVRRLRLVEMGSPVSVHPNVELMRGALMEAGRPDLAARFDGTMGDDDESPAWCDVDTQTGLERLGEADVRIVLRACALLGLTTLCSDCYAAGVRAPRREDGSPVECEHGGRLG